MSKRNWSKSTAYGREAERIKEAMDPANAPAKVKRLEDMTEEEIQAMEAKYGCKIKRPGKE